MSIKSSQKLVEEANQTIETLSPNEVKKLLEKNNEVKALLNIREINELFDLKYFLKNINAIYKKVLG